jgi:heme oxygenase (biliverdin-IX-beta and delta-forming)
MNLELLRSESRPEHEATEGVMPRFDGAFGRAEYVSALVGMYGAVRAWDEWAEVWAPEDLREMVRARRRGPSLERDLEFFGINPPKRSLDGAPALGEDARTFRGARGDEARRAAFLGMMYVVEGSTLGGQYIAGRAEEVLGLTPGEGDAFFRGVGGKTGERWREFRGVLGAVPEEFTGVVVGAARDMFGFFRGCLAGVGV